MDRRETHVHVVRAVGMIFLTVGLVLALTGCDWTTEPADEESLVVEAFLETGRPLPAVTLRQTRPLNPQRDTLVDAASGAQVQLSVGTRTVEYDSSPDQPGRYVPADETLVVPARAPWFLTVEWNGETARAGGMTPPTIGITEVCVDVPDAPSRAIQVDSLRRDSLDIPADQGYLYPIEVTVQWEGRAPGSETDSKYWVRAQLRPDSSPFPSEVVEFFLEPANVQREDRFPQKEGGRKWEGVYAVPVDSSADPLPTHDLTTALVRGDTTFSSFAQTRTDPDRREPISNVEGALGVALGVSVDSVSQVIRPGIEQCVTTP